MIKSHWGRNARVALAALLLAAPLPAQTLPRGDELLAKFRDAMGGKANIEKHTMMHMVAEFEMPAQGMKGNVEAWSMVPDKFLSVVEIPGLGSIKQGYDGKTGWSINPMMGPTIISGRELAQMKEQADLHSILHPEKFVKARETVEKTTFDNKEAYKVKVSPIEGAEYFEFYDVNTGLMIGTIRTAENAMGSMEMTSIVSEYQNIDGQLMPMKMRQSVMGMDQIITIKKVEFTGVDPKVFEVPAEIKALIK